LWEDGFSEREEKGGEGRKHKINVCEKRPREKRWRAVEVAVKESTSIMGAMDVACSLLLLYIISTLYS
jgi:hypothetical protein